MLSMRQKFVLVIIITCIVVVVSLVFIFKILVKNFNPGTGDVSTKQLVDLKTDAVFYVQPPGIQMNGSITQTPAQNKLAFGSTATNEPEIKESFVSDRPAPEIYQFYEQLATKDGWQMENNGSNGFAETWTKTLSGNAIGFLSLAHAENYPNGQIYTLSGNITTTPK